MNEFRVDALSSFDEGYLVGLYLGDGYLNYNKKDRHYRAELFLNSERDNDIKIHLKGLLSKVGLNPKEIKDKRSNSLKIRVNSKRYFNYLRENIQKFKTTLDFGLDYKRGFLAGFIDAEGYVTKGEIVLTQKNKEILDQIERICGSLGVIVKKVWFFKNYKTPNKIWRMRISPKSRGDNLRSVKIMRIYGGAYGLLP